MPRGVCGCAGVLVGEGTLGMGTWRGGSLCVAGCGYMAVCGCVWLGVATWLCVAVCGWVWLHGCVWLCVAVCGGVALWLRATAGAQLAPSSSP
jgi:hypothetical protein